MAITLYTGLQGSGKSYEVVSSPILEAIRVGRRVVTNIDGVDSEKIRQYVALRDHIDIEKLGYVDHVKNDDINDPLFFPTYGNNETVGKAGDLFVIDECWRFWGTGKKSLVHHEVFFREHRHFIHPETKVSCDIVLITQSAPDLSRFVKEVVELSFRMTKLKSVGLANNYRVDSYEGAQQRAARRINSWQKKYNKEIFDLYSSYEGGKGVEKQVDDRQNIFKDPKTWGVLIGSVVFLIAGVFGLVYVYKKYSSPEKKDVKQESTDKKKPALNDPKQTAQADKKPQIEYSSEWRVVGSVVNDRGAFQVIKNNAGDLRFVPYTEFTFAGFSRYGEVDGKRVNYSTGGGGQSSFSGAMK